MLEIGYSSHFLRRFKKLPATFQEEVIVRIEEFKNTAHHKNLGVHKLKGYLKNYFAFSINYRDRIIFEYNKNKKKAYLLDIGDHSIYE